VIGETVGSYKILSKLSVGGMGTVFRAEHTLIGKLAAVKVLHKELTTNEELVKRFFNEAKATAAIKHPGIVDVYDYGYMSSGDAYLAMEFLEGMSLARRLKTRGKMSEGEAAMFLRQVCSALSAAHQKGIVHRDLKPDNIFMCTDPDSPTGDRPKILDFGIAKLTDVGLAGSATKTGAVMGTPTYMSPEQCKGTGDVDHRADLYSLGCIFYELVTGRPPFTKLGAGELIGAHIYAVPDSPSKFNPGITKDSERLIMSLLQKRPEKRPQTAKELAQRLTQLAQSLGWITVTSPDGITGRSLRDLSSGPVLIPPAPTDRDRLAETQLPELPEPSGTDATTPYGLESSASHEDPSIFISHDAIEKPTTLTSAASESVISGHNLMRRKSRKGAVIALLSVATLAAAAVVVFKVTRTDGNAGAANQPSGPVVPVTPDKPPPPPEPAKTEPVKTEPVNTEPVKTEPEPVKAEPVKPEPVKPVIKKQPVIRKQPVKQPDKKLGAGSADKPKDPPPECKPPLCTVKTPL
jgi:eukaryotic-like serine/threonine-protein kinase